MLIAFLVALLLPLVGPEQEPVAEPIQFGILVDAPVGSEWALQLDEVQIQSGITYELPARNQPFVLRFTLSWVDGDEIVRRRREITVNPGDRIVIQFQVPRAWPNEAIC